jgi:hypothetical protein
VPVIAGTRMQERRSTMAQNTPRDRFDDVPVDLARIGAHRAPRRGRAFVTFAWAALATGVLVGAGVLALNGIEGNVSSAGAGSSVSSTSASAAPAPTVDPALDVVLLNATTTNGLAATASTKAEADGWKVGSTANASSNDVKTSTVYYTESSQQGAALGLAKSLGITRTALSQQFAVAGKSRLTVVLGGDFAAAN